MTLPLLATLLLLPPQAHAEAAFGLTAAFGQEGPTNSSAARGDYGTFPGFKYPSVDIHFSKWTVQAHVLELVDQLTAENLYLGAQARYNLYDRDVVGSVDGVIAPGVGFDYLSDLDFDDVNIGLTGQAALGAEVGSGMRLGLYVVPVIGLGAISGDAELLLGGWLQISVWTR